jgi:hypothetical protein
VLLPRLRIPLWAAVAIPAAAYAVRSVFRGSASPDLPGDAVVFAALVIALGLAARYGSAAVRRRDDLNAQVDDHDDSEGRKGKHDQV